MGFKKNFTPAVEIPPVYWLIFTYFTSGSLVKDENKINAIAKPLVKNLALENFSLYLS